MKDVLGHPITVGTKVLTPAYYGVSLDTIALVTKVTDKWQDSGKEACLSSISYRSSTCL